MIQQQAVQAHYGLGDLKSRVEQEIERAGLGSGTLTGAQLAPLDQFHVRGLAATKEMADALNLQKEDKILDVGCGLGGPARYLAATYGCSVTGIDLTESYIEVAKMLTLRTGQADRVDFRQADALQMPFADRSFDHVWTQHVAMNIADRPKLYAEIHRLLKPGGLLAIYDAIEGNGEPLHFPVPWASRPEISFLLTADAMHQTLEDAGFEMVDAQDTTDTAVAWFAELQAARQAASSQPVQQQAAPSLSLATVLDGDIATMVGNFGRNLKEGRARLVQVIVRRTGESQ